MNKYISKSFIISLDTPKEIDWWINGFEEYRMGRPACFYNYDVTGFASSDKLIIITMRVWSGDWDGDTPIAKLT